MQQTKWIERVFPVIADNGLLPNILERLEGTAARIAYKLSLFPNLPTGSSESRWSIKKEIGHLWDLEPLGLKRARQILSGAQNLEAADMTNEKTWKADHDDKSIEALLNNFAAARKELVDLYRSLASEDLDKLSFHPRLGQQMKLVDLAHFVAEHDDHHLARMHSLLLGMRK